jgi:bifunctional non-homologous end joining protein LigD
MGFAGEVADILVARRPDDLTTRFHKADRGDRIFVDVLRNRWAQTVVAPYAVRPRAQAPVATPLRWDELSDARLTPDRWTVRTLQRRLARVGDPWADIASAAASLGPARRRLAALRDDQGQGV